MAKLYIMDGRNYFDGHRYHYALVLSDDERETLWLGHREDTKAEARKAAKLWAKARDLRLREEAA